MKTDIHITQEELEEISKYLDGDLAPAEQHAFVQRLQDPEWQQKTAYVRLMQVGVEEAALSEALKKTPLTVSDSIVRYMHPRNVRRKPVWLAAASIILIIVALWISGVFTSSDQKLFAEFYRPDSGLITSMGVADEYNFDVAMIDYKTGNYTEAIEKWAILRKDHEKNDTLNYFIASAYLALKDAQQSLAYFETVLDQPQSAFYHDAQWYFGLALIKLGRDAEAVPYIAGSNHEERDKLLRKLTRK